MSHSAMKALLRGARRQLGTRRETAAPPPPAMRRIRRLEGRLDEVERELRDRLIEVEEGLYEQRALSQRIAVLSDFVAEVVSATARGDKESLDAALARYADDL